MVGLDAPWAHKSHAVSANMWKKRQQKKKAEKGMGSFLPINGAGEVGS